jgi:hypothetical protein
MPWSVDGTPISSTGTVVGTTGSSQAYGGAITAGDVVAAASLWFIGGDTNTYTPTFTDTAGNVASWTTSSFHGTVLSTSINIAIAWGIATTTTAPVAKVTWNTGTSGTIEIYLGCFTAPAGTVAADGAAATADVATGATVNTPAGNGAGASDLLICMAGLGGSSSGAAGSWVNMGASQGDQAAYALNVAGNTVPNIPQTGGGWESIVIALQVSGSPDLNINLIN